MTEVNADSFAVVILWRELLGSRWIIDKQTIPLFIICVCVHNIYLSIILHCRDSWKGSEHPGSREVLSQEMLGRVLEVGLKACQDKDKIRPHGVRCIGNVASFLQPHQVAHPTLVSLVTRTVDTLVTCASTGSNMKTRWNACHALGNIISSGRLPIATASWKVCIHSPFTFLVTNFFVYSMYYFPITQRLLQLCHCVSYAHPLLPLPHEISPPPSMPSPGPGIHHSGLSGGELQEL